MTTLHIKNNIEITQQQLQDFLDNFANREALNLCTQLQDEWTNFQDNYDLIVDIQLPLVNPVEFGAQLKKAGVYAIFPRFPNSESSKCFYVGMSAVNIQSRLNTHLGGDIIINYGGQFARLADCEDIYIGCATIKDSGIHNLDKKLKLLELCLGAQLRPFFLV